MSRLFHLRQQRSHTVVPDGRLGLGNSVFRSPLEIHASYEVLRRATTTKGARFTQRHRRFHGHDGVATLVASRFEQIAASRTTKRTRADCQAKCRTRGPPQGEPSTPARQVHRGAQTPFRPTPTCRRQSWHLGYREGQPPSQSGGPLRRARQDPFGTAIWQRDPHPTPPPPSK